MGIKYDIAYDKIWTGHINHEGGGGGIWPL